MKFHSSPAKASVALTFGAVLLGILFLEVCSLGIGGWTIFFRDPVRRDAALSLLALAALTPLCGCHIAVGQRKNHSNDWVLPALLVAGLALGFFSARSDRTGFLVLAGEPIRHIGLMLLLTGIVLRILAIRSLGNRFTVWVTIQADHELVTDRLYRHLRHPSYTGALLTLLGWALVCRSLPGVLIALAMGVLLMSRMDAEEELLVAYFPDEYPDYIERTWRLVPFVY